MTVVYLPTRVFDGGANALGDGLRALDVCLLLMVMSRFTHPTG